MAEQIGRDLLLQRAGATVAGLKNTTITFNSEPVDIGNGSSNGFFEAADQIGERSLEVSGEFVWDSNDLAEITLDNTLTTLKQTDFTVVFPLQDPVNTIPMSIAGDVVISSLEITGEYKDAVTGSLSIKFSGAWTFTAEAA